MDRVGVAPRTQNMNIPPTNLWFQIVSARMNVYEGPADPTVAEVPENQWILYRNTTIPEVRFWTNIAGVLLKSAAFT